MSGVLHAAMQKVQNIYYDDAAKTTMFALKRTEILITVNNVLSIM